MRAIATKYTGVVVLVALLATLGLATPAKASPPLPEHMCTWWYWYDDPNPPQGGWAKCFSVPGWYRVVVRCTNPSGSSRIVYGQWVVLPAVSLLLCNLRQGERATHVAADVLLH